MLPDEWTQTTLGAQLEKISGGGTPSRKNKSYWGETSDLPWLTVKDLKSRIISKTQEHITQEGLKNSASNLIPANTVIVCTRMAVGKAARCTVDVTINQDLKALYPKKSLDSEFLHNFLTANALKIDRLSSGSTVKGIQLSELKSLKMPLPPLAEQKLINDVISETEKRTELLTNLILEKQKQKKALMQRLLTGKHRFPEFEGQEWHEVELGDIFKEVKTKVGEKEVMPHSITAGTGFVSHAEKWGKDISGKQYENYTLLKKGQFAYNKGNSKKYACGCMYLLRHENEIAVPNVFISFERRKDNVCNEFYEQYFIADYCARELKRYITSGARSDGLLNLSKKDFFTVKVPLPPKAEQQKIAAVLNAADKEIDLLTAKLEAYQDQKKGLMQQLVTGKKRVKTAEKEKAVA